MSLPDCAAVSRRCAEQLGFAFGKNLVLQTRRSLSSRMASRMSPGVLQAFRGVEIGSLKVNRIPNLIKEPMFRTRRQGATNQLPRLLGIRRLNLACHRELPSPVFPRGLGIPTKNELGARAQDTQQVPQLIDFRLNRRSSTQQYIFGTVSNLQHESPADCCPHPSSRQDRPYGEPCEPRQGQRCHTVASARRPFFGLMDYQSRRHNCYLVGALSDVFFTTSSNEVPMRVHPGFLGR